MAQSYHNLAYNLDAQGEKESNWLPAPKDEFNLFMRLYWPKKEIPRRHLEAAGGGAAQVGPARPDG